MPTATVPTLYFKVRQFPLGVTIGGRTVGSSVAPKAPRYLELQEDVDTEITDLGKQFKDLHSGSITAQKIQRLHNYWLLGEAGEVQIPEPQKRFLDYLFNKFGKGIVLDNGVDYSDQGDLPEKEGYARALIVTQPKRFHTDLGEWEVEAGEIKPVHGYVPPTGFPLLTNDGIYNPDIFVPFATTSERKDAVASHIAKGVSPDVAQKAVSKFWSRNEGQGVAVVYAYCDNDSVYGRFFLNAVDNPGNWNGVVGRLASRLASGASQASQDEQAVLSPVGECREVLGVESTVLTNGEPKLIQVSEAEYMSLLSTAERASTLEGKLKSARDALQE